MSMRPPILQTQALCIGYRPHTRQEKTVAGPLELNILPGQLICLLGPNGAGKSTLLRTLAGLQPVLGGRVKIDGTSIALLEPAQMARKLSMVLTDRVRTGNLDVYSLIALGRYPYTGWLGTLSPTDKKIISWAITATQTQSFVHRKMDQLSDGESQKVMLARALAQDTPLIIMDEPTAHLDLPNRIELMRLLHHLARQTNKAILLSTHELDLALQAGDQIWLLYADGQLNQGVPEDLVLNGSFEKAFDKAGFSFDKTTGTFNIHQGEGTKVYIKGDGALAFWTRRALQREGYSIAEESQAEVIITIGGQDKAIIWGVAQDNHDQEYTSIAALLAGLSARNSMVEKVN